MDSVEDTDTLLAVLQSLLCVPVQDQAVLLDALVQSDGDPERAAQRLNSTPQTKKNSKRKNQDPERKSPTKKPKKSTDLNSWLQHSNQNATGTQTGLHDSPSTSVKAEPVSAAIISCPSSSTSPTKRMVDLKTVLRPPSPSSKGSNVPRLAPLTLSNPSLVAQHTPCTLHPSILSPELACKLFYTMLDLSQNWTRNKWWLFDRVVESPHRTAFYARNTDGVGSDENWQKAAQYWYNGRPTDSPAVFPDVMEEACVIIERIVNDEISRRKRFPLEWGGKGTEGQLWRANVAASNCYEGTKEGVGFHSDQLTHLGPYPTIASLSLGTNRTFRLREVVPTDELSTRRARTFNVPLPHNSLIIMHASCQETFKHSIPPQSVLDLYRPLYPRSPGLEPGPSNCRVNITFRFYRPDFGPDTIPRCKCDVPTILRPDMKSRQNGKTDRYWWTCYAGAQNDGKGCDFWRVMDMQTEGRGPTIGDMPVNSDVHSSAVDATSGSRSLAPDLL